MVVGDKVGNAVLLPQSIALDRILQHLPVQLRKQRTGHPASLYLTDFIPHDTDAAELPQGLAGFKIEHPAQLRRRLHLLQVQGSGTQLLIGHFGKGIVDHRMPQCLFVDIGAITLCHIDQTNGLQPSQHLLDRETGNVIDLCQFPLAGQLVHYGLALKDLADEVCNDELGLFGSHRQYPPLGSFAKDTTLGQKVQSPAHY